MGTRGCCCHSNGSLEFHFCGIRIFTSACNTIDTRVYCDQKQVQKVVYCGQIYVATTRVTREVLMFSTLHICMLNSQMYWFRVANNYMSTLLCYRYPIFSRYCSSLVCSATIAQPYFQPSANTVNPVNLTVVGGQLTSYTLQPSSQLCIL